MGLTNRISIGLLLFFDSAWMGGLLYIRNIIASVDQLPDEEKPKIILFYWREHADFVRDNIRYPYLAKHEIPKTSKWKVYLFGLLIGRNIVIEDLLSNPDMADGIGLFPVMDLPGRKINSKVKIVGWIPDFQHRAIPQNFTRLNYILRDWRFRQMAKQSDLLVLSSNSANQDFEEYYGQLADRTRVAILKFSSIIEPISESHLNATLINYNLAVPYFIVSNQFYTHKNHIVVFNAISLLKKQYGKFKVVFTGKMEDYRNPKFISSLREKLASLEIDSHVMMVGLIPRADQLALMKGALALIQPSKFEGWNTSIEDAKALSVRVIASDLDVHKEQLGQNGYFFNPDRDDDLSAIMFNLLKQGSAPLSRQENYNNQILNGARHFLTFFKNKEESLPSLLT